MVSETKWLGFKRDRLTVVEYLGKLKYNKHWWKCICICGGEINLSSQHVKKGPISCGCFRKETLLKNRFDGYKHGLHDHTLYSIYYNIHQRCYNPKTCRYEYYGGKGIKVCPEWHDFFTFYVWAVNNNWKEGLSIDRIDSDKDYEPSNCQWITISENTKKCNELKTRNKNGTFQRKIYKNKTKT